SAAGHSTPMSSEAGISAGRFPPRAGPTSSRRRSLSSMDSRDAPLTDPEACLLTFALGPVQPFIAAARSVRDLWTGSYLLSWLTSRAMRPILDRFGPEAFLMPAPENNPLLDGAVRSDRDRPSACLPNRFLAVVPGDPRGDLARTMAFECEAACLD